MNAKRERRCEVSLSLCYMYIMQKDRPFVDCLLLVIEQLLFKK